MLKKLVLPDCTGRVDGQKAKTKNPTDFLHSSKIIAKLKWANS